MGTEYNFKPYPEEIHKKCGWYLVWDGEALPRFAQWWDEWVDEHMRPIDCVSHFDYIPERPDGA